MDRTVVSCFNRKNYFIIFWKQLLKAQCLKITKKVSLHFFHSTNIFNFFSFFRQNSILERKFKWDILSDFQTLWIEQIQNMKTKEIILRLFFVADVAHMQNLKCKKKSAFIFESRRSRRRFWYFLHANLGGSFLPHPLGRDYVNSWKNVLKVSLQGL